MEATVAETNRRRAVQGAYNRDSDAALSRAPFTKRGVYLSAARRPAVSDHPVLRIGGARHLLTFCLLRKSGGGGGEQSSWGLSQG